MAGAAIQIADNGGEIGHLVNQAGWPAKPGRTMSATDPVDTSDSL
jgi:hypothetical protein